MVHPYLKRYDDIQWSAERSLEKIEGSVNVLEADKARLRTDADYADFLHRAERLRRELMAHSDDKGKDPLINRLNELIDSAMEMLEEN